MKITDKVAKSFGKGKSINSKIRICVECGSLLVSIDEKKIFCRECGSTKKFQDGMYGSQFNIGDYVKIIDSSKNHNIIYKISKIKKSKEGIIQFLLKSESAEINLLYNESKDSILEKIQK